MSISFYGDYFANTLRRSVHRSTQQLNQSTRRLATGTRVNRAADDPGGSVMASRLNSSLRGTRQAIRNGSDVFSMLRTADSTLAEQNEILHRLRELAVQAANGTLSTIDRANLEAEGITLRNELDRIGAQARFNGMNLFDGTFANKIFQMSDNAESEPLTVTFGTSDSYNLALDARESTAVFENFQSVAGATVQFDLSGVSIVHTAADPSDQASNAAALLASLDAASASLVPFGYTWSLTDSGLGVTINRTLGQTISIDNFISGSVVTDRTLANSIDATMTTNRTGLDATTYLDGNNGPVGSFASTITLTENDIDTGTPGIVNTTFEATPIAVEGGTTGLSTTDQIGSTLLLNPPSASDQINIVATRNDGTSTTFTYTFTTATDTLSDLFTAFNAAHSEYTMSLSGTGAIRLEEVTQSAGTSLAMSVVPVTTNTATETFSQTTERRLTSNNALSGSFNSSTLLSNITEFANVQGGDTLNVSLTDGSGTDRSFTFTFAGSINAASTSTVNDFMTALSTQTNITASFDTNTGIVVSDSSVPNGASIALSWTTGDFTERFSAASGSNATVNTTSLAFTASGQTLQSGAFTSGGAAVTSTTTTLNSIDGFSNIEGSDSFSINLTNYSGTSTTVTVTASDVTAGNASSMTIGDIISAINGTTLGSSTLSATLSASGQIEITEQSSDRSIGSNFDVGDTIDIAVTANDGSSLGTGTYTFTSANDTWDALRTAIEGIANVTGTYESDRLVFRENTRTVGSSVGITLSNYVDAANADGSFTGATFGSNGNNKVTTSSIISTAYTLATNINSISEFTDVNAGDQLLFRMTNGAGTNRDFTYTFGGTTGELTTDTFQELVTAINLQTDMNAFFDSNINHIVIEDTTNSGTGVSFSFAMADFFELAGPSNQLDVTADSLSTGGATLLDSNTSTSVVAFDYDISTVDGASHAITSLDEAIRLMNLSRATLGAQMSRVDHRVSRLAAANEYLTQGKSAIMDADFAQETAQRASAELKRVSATNLIAVERRLKQVALNLLESTMGQGSGGIAVSFQRF